MSLFEENSKCDSRTRSETCLWLIGQPEKELPSNILPTNADVLKTFFFHHKTCKKTNQESIKCVSQELIQIWNKARIPTTYEPHIISKIKKISEEYILIKKNKRRSGEAQQIRELEFQRNLSKLLDVAHRDAYTLLKIDEDKAFLEDQRGNRLMRMSGVDVKLTQQENRVAERRIKEEVRRNREKRRRLETVVNSNQQSDRESEIEDQVDSDSDYEIEIPRHYRNQFAEVKDNERSSDCKEQRFLGDILCSQDVSSTLDRINLSDRKFTQLAAAIARASSQDLDSGSLSRSTVRRNRHKHRSVIDSEVRQEFQSVEKPPLLIHWDGKLMKDTTDYHPNADNSKSMAERLAVVVTGFEINKILGVVKIPSGTGQSQAKATFDLLSLWDTASDIIGMSFDTTASNTGPTSGACVLLQALLEKKLLYFACRHHVHEIIIGEVFIVLFGPSHGPTIELFQRFSKFWPNIDQTTYRSLDDSRFEEPLLHKLRAEVCASLTKCLSADDAYLPRDDYEEVIELCLLVLGYPSDTSVNFRQPGAHHRARWMAKIIYCFKIYLFRDQFQLTDAEARNLTEMCLFAAHVYVTAWISCPVASDAPYNDLLLYRRINQYAEINASVSVAAMKKFQGHMWYLGAEMIPLSLFSNKVGAEEKRLIVTAMVRSGDSWIDRGIKYPPGNCKDLDTKHLHDLVTPASNAALQQLGFDVRDISDCEPEKWGNIPSYQRTAAIVKSLKVVNDIAERSVALMTSINDSITRSESQMQKLIQVIEDNRRRVPDSSKKTLKSYTTRW